MSDPATTLDRLVANAGQLYSLPAVAMEVLELTNNPQVDARALKNCIENDAALTSKLLRVVNSSLFGLSREVSDLNQALALLGIKPLKLLVLGFSLPADLFAGVAGEVLQRYWRHTLTKAVAGREISDTLFKIPGDEAFIAGLLQDLGILMLIQELGEPYVEFLQKVATKAKNLAELEIEVMGFDHTRLTAKLLAHWGLPQALVEAVAWETPRHRAGAAPLPDKTLPQILYLAELLARLLADKRAGALGELLETCREFEDLTRDQLETLVVNLAEKVQHLAEILSLQLPDGLDYRDVLVQAHTQLAEAAEELVCSPSGRAFRSEHASSWAEFQVLAEAVAEASSRLPAPPRPAESPASSSPPDAAATAAAAAKPRGAARPVAVAPDPGLLGRLGVAVAACRQFRCSLSLLLIQLDEVDQLLVTRGMAGLDRLRQFLATLCKDVDHPCAICLPHGEAGFALVLPDCERRRAVELANQLLEAVRRLAPGSNGPQRQAVSISVGVATVALPPKNFPAEKLLASAERCLYASQASSGGGVKSIEIY